MINYILAGAWLLMAFMSSAVNGWELSMISYVSLIISNIWLASIK